MKNTDRLRSLKIGEYFVFPPGKKETIRTTRDRLQRKNLGKWVIDSGRITRVSMPLTPEERAKISDRIKGVLLTVRSRYKIDGEIDGISFEGAGSARDVDGEPISFEFSVKVTKFDNEFDTIISNEYIYENNQNYLTISE